MWKSGYNVGLHGPLNNDSSHRKPAKLFYHINSSTDPEFLSYLDKTSNVIEFYPPFLEDTHKAWSQAAGTLMRPWPAGGKR